jgi:hypothetical protein
MACPHRDYHRHRARQIAAGAWQPWADPAPVRDHVQDLLRAATFQAVGDAAGVAPMTVWEIARGTRPVIKTGTAQALLAVQPADIRPPRVDANGPMWRLRSLIAMGHTTGRITAALGTSPHTVQALVRGERATVTAGLAGDITRLFDAWWDKQPSRQTRGEKAAACKARQRAAGHHWPCPAALDDDELDQPGYQPAAGWRYARGTGTAEGDPLGKTRDKQPEPGQPSAGRTAEPERESNSESEGSTMAYPNHGNGRYLVPSKDDEIQAPGTGERDLKELDEPGLTPGTPHPDPALAAKGWRLCDHGIYTRHPDGHLEAEPEAC